MLTEIDPAKVEKAADEIYARGFRDGVKWANAGVRAKIREIDRLMARSEKRTADVQGPERSGGNG